MSQETVPAFEGYADFLSDIKGRIQTAQLRAALSLSREVVWLYWQIGDEVRQRQARHGWGAKVVDRLAADLKASFPAVAGFSRTNLLYMRAFAEAYPDSAIVQQLLDDSPLPGGTTSGSWTGSRMQSSGCGTSAPRTSTDGAGPSWNTRSRAACTGGRGRR